MRNLSFVAAALVLAGCSATSPVSPTNVTNGINTVVTQGQLYCQIATTFGPVVMALVDSVTGAPVSVIGQAAETVAKACAVIGAVPVPPPADAVATPVVAVKLTHK